MAEPLESEHAAAAQAALREFPVEPASLHFVRLSENITFRVFARNDPRSFVLRLHRPDYHTHAELKSERIWTRALASAGVPTPTPVPALSGEDYVQVTMANRERRWASLSVWVDGDLLSSALDAEPAASVRSAHFRRLGALFAAAHNQASGWRPPLGFVRHSLDADGLMGAAPFWGPFWEHAILSAAERRVFLALRDKLRGAMLRYGKPSRAYSMIHADLHPLNVIVEGETLAMIDFDDAAFGWHQYDLAVALRPYDTHPDFGLYRNALIEGYRSRREISDADLALTPMFILARRLAEVGWLHQRPEIQAADRLARNKDYICAAAAGFEPPC